MGAAAAARPWGQKGGWPTLATASSCHLWADLRQRGQGWWEAVAGPAPPRGNDVPSRPEPPRRSGQAGGFCHCYGTGAAEGAPAVGAHAGRVDGRPPRRLMAAKGQHQIRGARHLQLLGPSGWRFTRRRDNRGFEGRTDSPTAQQSSEQFALCLTSCAQANLRSTKSTCGFQHLVLTPRPRPLQLPREVLRADHSHPTR